MKTSSSSDQFLTSRVHRTARLLDRGESDAYTVACGLGIAEARCLVAIGSSDSLSLVDLALAVHQDKGQASRSAQALVARGLVRKEASPVDARSVVLTLTRSGRPLFARALKSVEAANGVAFAGLGPMERKTLATLLERVAATLEPEDDAPARGGVTRPSA